MRHALERVLDRMREIVHRIHAPLVAEMVVRHVADAVDDRIAEMDVGRCHVDLGPEAPFAVGVLAVAHLVEDAQVAFGIRVARGGRPAGALRHAAIFLPFVLREVAAVRLARLDQVLGDRIHAVEHVRGVPEARFRTIAFARPLETEPADVVLDVLGVFVGLLRGIRVVEAEMARAAEQLGHAEVDAYRLRVADVDVAVGFGRETRYDFAAGPAGGVIRFNPLPQEMPRGVGFDLVGHGVILPADVQEGQPRETLVADIVGEAELAAGEVVGPV